MTLEDMHTAMVILDEAKSSLRDLGMSKADLYAMDDMMEDLGAGIAAEEQDAKQTEADAFGDWKREQGLD